MRWNQAIFFSSSRKAKSEISLRPRQTSVKGLVAVSSGKKVKKRTRLAEIGPDVEIKNDEPVVDKMIKAPARKKAV